MDVEAVPYLESRLNLIWLALIGLIESYVYLRRYRSAVGKCPLRSANDAFLTVVLWTGTMWVGVSAIVGNTPPWLVMLAYGIPVWAGTYLCHKWMEEKKK